MSLDAMTELRKSTIGAEYRIGRGENLADVLRAGPVGFYSMPHHEPLPPRDNSHWVQTFSGKQCWPLNPKPEDIDIVDIAHALSNLCRYAGHCREFYSVAQHSVIVSNNVPPADALWGLLHDAPEAFICDLPRPVKHAIPGYRDIEERLMAIIAFCFSLPLQMPPSVKIADNRALATERRDLMATPPIPWIQTENVEPFPNRIEAVSPARAKQMFMDRFLELTQPPSNQEIDDTELARMTAEGAPAIDD
jgi:5'-deoxynucleotidase YfbR-like HD superfamily hydrolase